ncbi:GTPase [Maribacter sp. CXY002]|uniref:GTPase n=1 Tax=Maribacter luteocoastalis TaxID=3407671 RepID=UPI003B67B1C3
MTNTKVIKLLFVYNAGSSLRNRIFDGAHKIISPSTYTCSLCSLTFGSFTEKNIWKQFRLNLVNDGFTLDFLHKDEFESKFDNIFSFPIILFEVKKGLEILISTEELNQLNRAADLIDMTKEKIALLK